MDTLAQDAPSCDFFQAVRLLQQRFHAYPRVGYANLPKDEPLRLGQAPTLATPASLIKEYVPAGGGAPARLTLTYHGLLGANGPLPLNYTEHALERAHVHRDNTLVAFLDVFHHRMMSFLARAWADSNIAVDFDRPEESRFARYVASLVGAGEPSTPGDSLPEHSRLHYAGWLNRGARPAEGLGKILGEFFGVPASVQPFRGRWLRIPEEDRSQLGSSGMVLGESVILGESVWDCTLSFRIFFGPVEFERYCEMIPGRRSFQRLCDWVRAYAGLEFFWDVAFIVKAERIPVIRLGESVQLGYNAWLNSGQKRSGECEVSFAPRAA